MFLCLVIPNHFVSVKSIRIRRRLSLALPRRRAHRFDEGAGARGGDTGARGRRQWGGERLRSHCDKAGWRPGESMMIDPTR